MLAPEWTWSGTAPVILVSALLLFAPGTFAARVLGARGWNAFALGPLLTATIVGVSGVLASFMKVDWSAVVLLVAISLSCLAAFGVRLILNRWRAPELLDTWSSAAAPALIAAAVIAGWIVVSASGQPGNFPQHPDTIFHLGVSKFLLEREDISSLTASGFSTSRPGFYPAALHGVVATVSMLTGAPAVVAMSSVLVVVVSLVWPLGMMSLGRATFDGSRLTIWASALSAVTLTVFPFQLLGYGPVWPMLFGLTLIPSALSLVVRAVSPTVHQWAGLRPHMVRAARPMVLLLAGVPGLTLAHPTAALTGVIFAWLVLLMAPTRAADGWMQTMSAPLTRPRHARHRTFATRALLPPGIAPRHQCQSTPALMARGCQAFCLVLLLGLGGWVIGTVRAPSSRLATGDTANRPLGEVLLAAATFWDEPTWSAIVLILLVALGVGAAVASADRRWVVPALMLTFTLAVVREAGGIDVSAPFTWPWWNDIYRLRALVAIPAALCMVAGLLLLHRIMLLARIPPRPASAVLATIVLITSIAQAPAAKTVLHGYFHATGAAAWVMPTELDALRDISDALPDNAVVAANPWNGATYLYLVGPERLLHPTEKAVGGAAADYIDLHLDHAATDPAVCDAVVYLGVTHAIVGGDSYWFHDDSHFAGLDGVPTAPSGFSVLLAAPPYTVYSIDACGN